MSIFRGCDPVNCKPERSMTAEILANPAKHPLPIRGAHGPDPLAFHQRLPGYAVTPLVAAPGLAADLGLSRLWVKVESSRLGLPAFKMLGASWATYRVLCARLGAEPEWRTLDELRAALQPLGPLSLVAATDGNHGRAVARTAKLLGYSSRIFVPAGTAAARIEAIESEGATVTVVDGTYDDAVVASAAEAADRVLVISDTSWEGYTDVPRWVIDGYSTIFAEVDDQLGSAVPDVVAVQMGVGALTAAVVDRYAGSAAIVAVEPLAAACGLRSAEAGRPTYVPGPHDSIMAGLNCGAVSVVAWPTVSAGVDVFVAVDDPAAEQAVRDLDAIGVVAGETGGAGLAGLRTLAASGAQAAGLELAGCSALVICTEGATDPIAYERITGHPPS
jgi:diaminopropionate ammonia-lyase